MTVVSVEDVAVRLRPQASVSRRQVAPEDRSRLTPRSGCYAASTSRRHIAAVRPPLEDVFPPATPRSQRQPTQHTPTSPRSHRHCSTLALPGLPPALKHAYTARSGLPAALKYACSTRSASVTQLPSATSTGSACHAKSHRSRWIAPDGSLRYSQVTMRGDQDNTIQGKPVTPRYPKTSLKP